MRCDETCACVRCMVSGSVQERRPMRHGLSIKLYIHYGPFYYHILGQNT